MSEETFNMDLRKFLKRFGAMLSANSRRYSRVSRPGRCSQARERAPGSGRRHAGGPGDQGAFGYLNDIWPTCRLFAPNKRHSDNSDLRDKRGFQSIDAHRPRIHCRGS
jgi:hypothetical protein